MDQDILIRDFKKGDEGQLVELLNPFFENISDIDKWENFYQKGASGAAVISVAEYLPDNKIFGHYAVLNMPMVIFGDKCMGGKGEGSVVNRLFMKTILQKGSKIKNPVLPELIKNSLNNAVQNGALIICSNPNNLALKAHLETGHEILSHEFDIFILALKRRYLTHLIYKKINSKLLANIVSFILFPVISCLYHYGKTFSQKSRIEIAPLEHFDRVTDSIVEEFHSIHKCITMQRDSEYLNVRFSNKEYKKFVVKQNNKPVGYVVMRVFINQNGFKEALLADYILASAYWDVFKDMVYEMIGVARKYNCDIFRVNHLYDYKKNFNISDMLKKVHFLKRPDQRNLVIFLSPLFAKGRSRALDINDWFFTDLYFEIS